MCTTAVSAALTFAWQIGMAVGYKNSLIFIHSVTHVLVIKIILVSIIYS